MTAYFHLDRPDNMIGVYHDYSCIAEGLLSLGIVCFGNIDMCQTEAQGDFLIKHDKHFDMKDADFVFFHYVMYRDNYSKANETIQTITGIPNRRFRVFFIDSSDGVRTPGFSKGGHSCDVVLKSHYNRKYNYPPNFTPWQFGLTKRIINAIHPAPFHERDNSILVNFRVKHQLRDYVSTLIRPIVENCFLWDNQTNGFTSAGLEGNDFHYWHKTGGRHFPQYYNKLSCTKLCACYGGVFALPWGNYNKYTAKIIRQLNDIFKVSKWDRVRQWDSWRLWEAWVAGCCVIHIDFEKYGCVLPVMPENGVHYIGLDIENMEKFEYQLNGDIGTIADNGRKFALDNYSPIKIGLACLALLRKVK